MKLTLDARLIGGSGIGVYIQNLVKNPLLHRFDLELLVHHEHIAFAKNICPQAKVKEYNAGIYSIKELIASPLKTLNTNIFWSPHYNIPVLNFASDLKITTIHDVYHLAYSDTLSIKQKLYGETMIRRAVNYSDLVYTVSNFSKSEIIKKIKCDPDKINVVYNGIDFSRFIKVFSRKEGQAIFNKYSLPELYVLFVGNVKPHKNLKTALLGFKYYCQSSPSTNLKFVIAGKKDGFITGDEEVKKMIEEPFFKEKVQFTGWISDEDLPLIYQKASLFIFPSIYEGFGFPSLEAMAAGCPVISSNSACMPEIYDDAALYFYPLDKKGIGERIHEVLHNSEIRAELVKKGLKKAQEYSWDEAVKQKLLLIENYLSKN
jgi:glycosyltransferase involved in cell wall biosynthesis